MNKFIKSYWAFRNWFRDTIFEPIWYRIFGHKFHIVRTKLTPSSWYDTDVRILYAVMGLVEWFVENDMRHPTKEEYQEEVDRINKENTCEWKESELQCWKDQYERGEKIIGIYNWWKNFDKRGEEITISLNAWHEHAKSFKIDPEDWFGKSRPMTKEDEDEDKRLLDYHRELERKLNQEEQDNLKLAIELRESMWS